jgi:hypothetical protein
MLWLSGSLVDEVATGRTGRNQATQAVVPLVEGGARRWIRCHAIAPAVHAARQAVAREGQQRLLPGRVRRVAARIPPAVAGSARNVGEAHGIVRREEARENSTHPCLIERVEVAAVRAVGDRIEAARHSSDLEDARNRQSRRGIRGCDAILRKVFRLCTEAGDAGPTIEHEAVCRCPLAASDLDDAGCAVAISAGEEVGCGGRVKRRMRDHPSSS